MLNKKITLNIFSSKTPIELTILSSCEKPVKKETIHKNCSKICFCTNECCIKLVAKHKNQTIYQTIRLNNCLCQNIFVGFGFFDFIPKEVLEIISLTDANYFGLPISNATLNFSQI